MAPVMMANNRDVRYVSCAEELLRALSQERRKFEGRWHPTPPTFEQGLCVAIQLLQNFASINCVENLVRTYLIKIAGEWMI